MFIGLGGSRASTAQKEERLGAGKEFEEWPEWLQRTPRRLGGLRGVICSAGAGQGVPARRDLGGRVLGLGLFPQF